MVGFASAYQDGTSPCLSVRGLSCESSAFRLVTAHLPCRARTRLNGLGYWQGRAFKSNKNLREHVKVHIDRGDILCPNPSSSSRHSPSPAPTPGRTTRASSEAAVPRGRKRTRDPDYADVDDELERHTKRLKRTESDVGKDWMCNEPECHKQFKTVGH